jgi:broad-specificity NMP kinase
MMSARECVMPKLISMEEIMSKKNLEGYLVPVVELAKYMDTDVTALKRKLKRRGYKIEKIVAMYCYCERAINVISAEDARTFLNSSAFDKRLILSEEIDKLI